MTKKMPPAKLLSSITYKLWTAARSFLFMVGAPLRFSMCHGHWRSCYEGIPCNGRGEPIPWYTYPSIEFLERRTFTGRRVLEFGGGASTIWWSARASSVTTVETDPDWCSYLQSTSPSNVNLIFFDKTAHSDTSLIQMIERCLNSTMYDIIVIDGRPRAQIVEFALNHISPGGAVIVDNAEGYDLLDAIRKHHVSRVDFFGFVPIVTLKHCTSLLFKSECFLLGPEPTIPRDTGWGSGLDTFFHRVRPCER
jgi:hypothetical protein